MLSRPHQSLFPLATFSGDHLEDDPGEPHRPAGGRRSKRRAMEDQTVAAFFEQSAQQRAAWDARDGGAFDRPSSPLQHDAADIRDPEHAET